MKTFEYKMVETPRGKTERKISIWLNMAGEQGWELVCFEYGYAIFKREIIDETQRHVS